MTEDVKVCIDKKYRLQWEPTQDCYVLLFAEGMVQLNNTASEILKLCDGSQSEVQIIERLKSEFSENDIESDVKEFFKEARENGWIE